MPPVLQELCPETDTQGSHDCPLRHQALQMQGESQQDFHHDNLTKRKVGIIMRLDSHNLGNKEN